MASNTRVTLDGTADDRDGKMQGTLHYHQLISQKPDGITLEKIAG